MDDSHIQSGWMLVLLFRTGNIGGKESLGQEAEGVKEINLILVIFELKVSVVLWDGSSTYNWVYSLALRVLSSI